MFLSTAKMIKRQGEKIHELEAELKLEKEANSELKNENIELSLKMRHLQRFKESIIFTMKEKGTIVDKFDTIKELVAKSEADN